MSESIASAKVAERPSKYWTEKPIFTNKPVTKLGSVDVRRVIVDGAEYKYSVHPRLPEIGERINIHMNGIGQAIVKGYFHEHDWVGVLAKPLKPPKWYVEQNKRYKGVLRDCAGVFGAEFDLKE
jgi:hypothetical protein